MSPERKAAKERLMGMKTRADLESYLDSLNLSDEEREIAFLVFGRGLSLTQIQVQYNYSTRQLRRKLSKVYDRMI